MRIEDILVKINFKSRAKKIGEIFQGKNRWLLFFIFLVSIGYCAYLWYGFIYSPKWDAAKKSDYISTKEKEVVFNRSKFESVTAGIEKRKSESQKKIENVPDIFRLK